MAQDATLLSCAQLSDLKLLASLGFKQQYWCRLVMWHFLFHFLLSDFFPLACIWAAWFFICLLKMKYWYDVVSCVLLAAARELSACHLVNLCMNLGRDLWFYFNYFKLFCASGHLSQEFHTFLTSKKREDGASGVCGGGGLLDIVQEVGRGHSIHTNGRVYATQ